MTNNVVWLAGRALNDIEYAWEITVDKPASKVRSWLGDPSRKYQSHGINKYPDIHAISPADFDPLYVLTDMIYNNYNYAE